MKNSKDYRRRPVLKNAPLYYAPGSELGVVFLFSDYIKRHRIRVEEIRPQFPDCLAFHKTGGKDRRINIEFELKSRAFKGHRRRSKKCNWLVCWEDNWPNKPEWMKPIKVIELRKYYGMGRNEWIQIAKDREDKKKILKKKTIEFSVASQAKKGDLVFFYESSPDKCFRAIFGLAEDANYCQKAAWKRGKAFRTKGDYRALVKRICLLKAPVFLKDLIRHPILKTAYFIRGRLQGRPNITEYWPYIYDLMIARNRNAKKALAKYQPEPV